MSVFTIIWKNIKWRYHNTFTIVVTILQPIIWLILYSTVASQTMKNTGIENYTAFILPGLIILVSFSACSSGGIMNYLMKTEGSFYRILIAPINRTSIILGQLVEAVLCTFLEVGIMVIISLLLSVKIATGLGGMLIILLLIFLTAFLMAGIAYSISLILPNEIVYETVMNAIVLPIFFLSSALFPIDGLSGGLKIAIKLNPFTHVIQAIREIMLTGFIPQREVLLSIGLLSVLSMLAFLLALYRLKKETDL